MAKVKQPQVSPPAPFEQNTTQNSEDISEVLETPDIAAFRAFTPDTTMLKAATDAQFENSRRNITDSYGAFSGIPSQVARNRMRDEALSDLEGQRATALATGNESAQALKMAQLQALAELTRKTKTTNTGTGKSSGYNTSVVQPQSSGVGNSLISGGATIGAAAIIA